MIEKLKTINPYDETEIDMDTNSVAGLVYENTPLVQKINELVDTVNELQAQVAILEEHAHPTAKTPEEFSWIGCVCRFWFDNPNDTVLDYLKDIKVCVNGFQYYGKECGDWFPNCEPVKPDDNIIYRGE